MAGRRPLHAGGRPLVDDLAVPVDLEPGHEGVGDDPADTVDLGQFLAARSPHGVERAEVLRERPGRHGPDVPDVQRDEQAGERACLGGVEVGEQLDRVLRGHRGLVAVELRRLRVVHAVLLRPTAAERRHALLGAVLVELRQAGLVVADDHRHREEVGHRQREEPSLGGQRRLCGFQGLRQRRCGHLTECFDVERSA